MDKRSQVNQEFFPVSEKCGVPPVDREALEAFSTGVEAGEVTGFQNSGPGRMVAPKWRRRGMPVWRSQF
jgi:hypothetical protein